MRRLTSVVTIVVDTVVLAIFVVLIALSNNTLTNYPGGVDAFGHLSKSDFILRYWPNVFWGNIWAGGMPFFRWYPPLTYYAVSLIAVLTGLTLASSLMLIFVVSLTLGALAVCLCIRALGGRQAASLAGGLSYCSSSMLWLYVGRGRNLPQNHIECFDRNFPLVRTGISGEPRWFTKG